MTAPSRLVPAVFRTRVRAAAVVGLVHPLAYVTFALLGGALLTPGTARRYAYPFIDAARYGYAHVTLNALVLGAAFYPPGLALVAAGPLPPDASPGPATAPRKPDFVSGERSAKVIDVARAASAAGRRSGCSAAWQRASFGTKRSWVQIPPPRR